MEKPNYYSITPAEVRYDQDLTPNAKLLYGEITALANKSGFCWASNQHFAELYNVSTTSISIWVSQLKEKGYISVEVKENYKRKIYIGVLRKLKGGIKKTLRGVLRKVKDNNKTNIKKNTKDFSNEKSERELIKIKDTYKSKYDIARQKGITLKKTPRTSKQEETTQVFKAIDYYRDKAMEIHGMQFMKVHDESRNKAVRKLAIRAGKEVELTKLIDWWLDGAGEWAGYEPEPCFSTKMIERFTNSGIKPEKAKPIQEIGNMKFYTKEQIKQAEKDGKIKWSWEKNRWQVNN